MKGKDRDHSRLTIVYRYDIYDTGYNENHSQLEHFPDAFKRRTRRMNTS